MTPLPAGYRHISHCSSSKLPLSEQPLHHGFKPALLQRCLVWDIRPPYRLLWHSKNYLPFFRWGQNQTLEKFIRSQIKHPAGSSEQGTELLTAETLLLRKMLLHKNQTTHPTKDRYPMVTWTCWEPSPFISTLFLKDSTARKTRLIRNGKWTTVPKYQVLMFGPERNTWSSSSAFFLRLMQGVGVTSPTMGQQLCILFAQGLSYVIQWQPQSQGSAHFPPFFQFSLTCADWERNHAAEAALLPPPRMDRLGRELAHNLPSYGAMLTLLFLINAAFTVGEGITKSMKNPFHIPLAPHKPPFLYRAINLQERTELYFPKNLQKQWKICILQN